MLLYKHMGHTPETRKRAYAKTKEARKTFFQGKACVKCNATSDLQLDHINPAEKIDHNIWSWSEESRNAEIKKCQILCKECHKRKTKDDLRKMFSKPIEHGTATAYEHKGCRCELCRDARGKARKKRKLKNGHW